MSKVIVNLAVGNPFSSWHHKGRIRLLKSLFKHETGEVFYMSNARRDVRLKSPYEDKLAFIKQAKSDGHDMILWLDCSIQAIRPLDDIWKWIEEKGYYLYASEYNCAQTCNDNALGIYGVTRDDAENITDVASNVVGINLRHPIGSAFFHKWTRSLKTTANLGEKWPTEKQRLREGQPPFQFHRQDQSTASLAAKDLELQRHNHFVYRLEGEGRMNDSVIFTLSGGY